MNATITQPAKEKLTALEQRRIVQAMREQFQEELDAAKGISAVLNKVGDIEIECKGAKSKLIVYAHRNHTHAIVRAFLPNNEKVNVEILLMQGSRRVRASVIRITSLVKACLRG